MTPLQVSELFRLYIDEPDQTFISDANIETFLSAGYREFREFVTDIDPYVFLGAEPVTFSGRTFGLDPVFLGPAPTAAFGRMLRLVAVVRDTPETFMLNIVQSPEALAMTPSGCFWSADQLMFSAPLSGDWQVLYLGDPDITWTNSPGPATPFLDDLTSFHDVIALLAYKQYAIMDVANNEQLLQQLQFRLPKLEQYIRERTSAGPSYVQLVTL